MVVTHETGWNESFRLSVRTCCGVQSVSSPMNTGVEMSGGRNRPLAFHCPVNNVRSFLYSLRRLKGLVLRDRDSFILLLALWGSLEDNSYH
jgi:hypothetical protein